MKPSSDRPTPLPESLRRATISLGARVRKLAHTRGAGAIAACLLSSWLVLFASDRLWDTPGLVRMFLAGAGWAGAILMFLAWYRGGILLPQSEIHLAKLVRSKFGGPGDRFLGVLELARRAPEETRHSEALFEAAAKKVEQEISRLELNEAVDVRPSRRALSLCAGAALLVGIITLTLPKIAQNAWERWATPWNNSPRLTLTTPAWFPAQTFCARGEPVPLRCILSKDSRRKPEVAVLISSTGQEFSAKRNGLIYEFLLPGQFEARDWALEVGDARAILQVTPLERPRIERLDAIVDLPDYLGYPRERKTIGGTRVKVLKGTNLTLAGASNRPIERVGVRTKSTHFDVAADKETFKAELGIVAESFDAQIRFTDIFGLSAATPTALAVNSIPDEAPRVDFENLPGESAILETETLDLRVIAKDDYGITMLELYLGVQGIDGQSHEPDRLSKKEEQTTDAKTLDLAFPFDPSFLGLKGGDVAILTAKAIDREPDREPSVSREIILHVLGPEEHAEAVRRRMEEILAQVSEIAREEESIMLENVRLSDEAFDELDERQSDKALDNLAESQRDNARDLRETAEEGAETLREALRNPLFDENTLKEWSETLRKMEEVASSEMAKAAQSIEQAKANPSSAKPNLSEAEQSEQEALESLREILEQANEQLDDLEALTLAQRLRQVQKTENRLGEVLVSHLPSTIGHRSKALPEKQLKVQIELENTQIDAHVETELLQGEISRFHERTGRENYGEVGKLMEEEGAVEGLRKGSDLIRKNVAFAALENLDHWEEKFKEWADMLEEEEDSGGGGGGGGGGGETKDLTAQLVALLRIREKQKAILGKSKLLVDHFKEEVRKDRSLILGQNQRELMTDLTEVQVEMAIEEINPVFDDAHTYMATSAAGLEKEEFGSTTTLAQTQSRDSISDIINLLIEAAQSGSQGSSAGNSQALQFLLSQLSGQKPGQGKGMMPGQTGGGSQQGGDTDQEHDNTTGNADGIAPGNRKTQQAGGASGVPPPEFRRAMENYFRQIEE
jgi:hypothetical protein